MILFRRNEKVGFLFLSKSWVVTLTLRALGYVAKIFTKSKFETLVCFSDEARVLWTMGNTMGWNLLWSSISYFSAPLFSRYTTSFTFIKYYDMISIEEMYLRNAISGNISPQYEKVVEFPFQAHEIALILMHHMGIMK